MRPPASESKTAPRALKKVGRVNTPTFSTESAKNGLMRCNKVGAASKFVISGVQLTEQSLGLLQIYRVEAFGEPAPS